MKQNQSSRGRAGRVTVLLAVFALAGLFFSSANATFGGFLVSTSDPVGLNATGNWLYGGETKIVWTVSQNLDNSWHYHYEFSHPEGQTSHFILETSPNFTSADVWNEEGDFSNFAVGSQPANSGSPNMPEAVFGIRFEPMWGTLTVIDLDSPRFPVWGDFYAKNGSPGGYEVSSAWNDGFTLNDWDPIAPAQDGSIANHILVPDTITSVPEPSPLMLLGGALVGAFVLRRKLG